MKSFWMLLLSLLVVVMLASSQLSIAAAQQEAATSSTSSAVANASADTAAQAESSGEEQSDEDEEEAEAEENKDDDSGDNEEEEEEDADDDDEEEEEGKEEEERETHTIESEKLKITFETNGTFVASEMSEVELDPEAWTAFEIEEIVPHGATVRKGEVLVKFDGEKLRDAIDALELDQRLNELAIIKREQELPRLETSIKKSFEQAERSLDEALVDYKNYKETDRELLIKTVEMNLKSTEQYTENAREELRQLEKMYEADDLTEETEEIILKRQRAAVEEADFYLERAKLSHDRNLNLFLPRRDTQEKEYMEQVKLAFERAKTSLETDLSKARYELEKAKRTRAKSLEKHAKLTSDLSLLEIKSPADGVVYYGRCTNGEWSDTASLIGKLLVESNAPTGSTLMTIVEPQPLYIVSSVKEASRPSVAEGQTATMKPTATDSPKLAAKVSKLSSIPVASGKFAMELKLTDDDYPEWLVAGMTGKVKVTTYEKKDALLAPTKAVHSEEDDEDEKFVWLVEEDEIEKRAVTTGKTKGDNVEILDGLEAGDVISLDDEEEEADDDAGNGDDEGED